MRLPRVGADVHPRRHADSPSSRRESKRVNACSTTSGTSRPPNLGDSNTHHKIEWAVGGETSLENSALLCERHHTQVHHGYRIERQPGGWHTYRPDGTEIVVPSEPAAA